MDMEITLLHFDDCPNWETVDRQLDELQSVYEFEVTRIKVNSIEDAVRLQFRGSPSILIDGVDPFARAEDPVGLSCRIYRTPKGLQGAPTRHMLETEIGGAARRAKRQTENDS